MFVLANGTWFREDVVDRARQLCVLLVDGRFVRDQRFDLTVEGTKFCWYGNRITEYNDEWYFEPIIKKGDKHVTVDKAEISGEDFTFKGCVLFKMKNKLDELVLRIGGKLFGPVVPTKI